jgi:dTDP-4-dehydrorhamnose 3,5-epimerase
MPVIAGVETKPLETYSDERGFFREILRATDGIFADGFAQLSHSVMHTGVVKAWHVHDQQTDWWYVCGGVVKVVLFDARPGSQSYRTTMERLMGDGHPSCVIRIPPGVVHGCRCVQGPGHLFYVTSRVYDPADELRRPHDDPDIGYDWLALPPIS